MKKFVWILLLVCLVLGCVVGYAASRSEAKAHLPSPLYAPESTPVGADSIPALSGDIVIVEQNGEEGQEQEGSEVQISEELEIEQDAHDADVPSDAQSYVPVPGLDYDMIRALHEPEDVVAVVEGRDVTWDEYFYWLRDVGMQAENYVQMLALYSQSLDWDDKLSADSEQTLAEYVIELTHDNIRQLAVVEAVAEENGVTLTREDEADLAAQLKETIASVCGEGATEADFNAFLEENHISRTMYDRITRANYLYRDTYIALYGKNGEKVPDENALAYLEKNNYLAAAHILFMTIDPDTYEALDEDTIAQKRAQAEEVAAELRAIDNEGTRARRFAVLKEKYCEDPDRVDFPDGYLFTPGTMVDEFEDCVKSLEEYEVSKPVLSSFGYHVIMRLPLDPDMTIQYSDEETPLTGRAICADSDFTAMLNDRIVQCSVTLKGAAIDLTQFLKEE